MSRKGEASSRRAAARTGAASGERTPTPSRLPMFLLAAALVLVVGRLALWLAHPLASEDAYITFRYARMLVEGHGLTYNPGERVMGFSSPPWVLWCALGALLHVDLVGWTRATSLVADLATLWLGWQLLASTATPMAARAFAVFFAGWPLFAAASATGLEVSSFVALAFLAAWLTTRDAPAAGPVLGLFAVMRPEGLAAAALIGLRASWRARLLALLLVGLAVAGLASYFGSAVPQSVTAKSMLYGTPGPWAGRHWWEWLVPFPLGRFPVTGEGQHLMPIVAVFAAATVVGAGSLAREWRSAAALAAGAGVTVLLGYTVLGVAYFWWYLVLPFAALALVAATGFSQVVRGRAIPVAAALMVLGTWTVAVPLYVGRAQAEANAFVPVATLLQRESRPGESVLLEPIGLIGYRTNLRVLDESGLVSPGVALRRVRGAGWYADVVARQRPDWLVVRPDALESGQAFAGAGGLFRSAAERDSTLARYRLVQPAGTRPGSSLAVLRRVDRAAPAAAAPVAR